MATLAELLAANSPASQALIAAALRRGQVSTNDLLAPGSYDPNLDFQQQNQNLGYLNTVGDASLQGSRINEGLQGGSGFYANPVTGQRLDYQAPGSLAEAQHAYDRQVGQATQQHDYTLADLLTGKTRGHEDLQRQLKYGTEDYGTNVQNLQRQYQRLGSNQSTAVRRSGLGQGALTQALQKRTVNQAIDRAPIDTGFNRLKQGVDTSENRLNEDYTTNVGRADTSWRDLVGADGKGGELGYQAGLQRNSLIGQAAQGQQDVDTGAQRAGAANTLFGSQVGQAKVQSAQQMGTLPELPTPDMTHGTAASPAFQRMGIPSSTPTHIGAEGTYIEQPAVGGGVWHIYENGRRVKVK